MLFPIVIHQAGESSYGVTVPDLPGCFSSGKTLDEAMASAHEAIEAHLELLAEAGADIPHAGTVQAYVAHPDYAGGVWALANVDITPYLGKAEKINVTLPGRLLRRIDDVVGHNPRFKSRSGFLAEGALLLLERARRA